MWQAICPHWWEAKQTLVQQVALLQAAGALSASQRRIMWPTSSRLWQALGSLRHKPNSHFVTCSHYLTNYDSVCDKPTNTNRLWLGNVLRATTAWTFSSIIWPDGSAPVALASHKSLEKHSVSWLSYLFSHLHLLSPDSFSFLIFFLLLSSSLCLCPSLHFSSAHIVGSLTSKLPSKADCMTR